jgi:hypothetical protein
MKQTAMSDKFQQYRRSQIAELRPYEPGESMEGISISATDKEAGFAKAWRHDCSKPRRTMPISGSCPPNILPIISSLFHEGKAAERSNLKREDAYSSLYSAHRCFLKRSKGAPLRSVILWMCWRHGSN